MASLDQTSKGTEAIQEAPKNFSPSPDFKWLCEELFEKIEKIQRQPKQERINLKPVSVRYYEAIDHFVNLWRTTVGNNIFPALVLILPYRDRRMYNIKDYTLVKAICNYLNLSKNSPTEKRLLRWKKRAGRGVTLSNFCVEEIKKRKREPLHRPRITIDKINECLDSLVEERNNKSRSFKSISESTSFKFCLENLSFLELKYFFDIILKNRLIGGQEHKFLNCWHPDAQDYLSVVSDLKLVANKLWDRSCRLKNDDLGINIGYAFVPHLAKKLSISYENICKKLKHDFLIEEKMDGERIQLHYMEYGANLKFFSRRGVEYTYLYGSNVRDGSVSSFLNLDKNVKECVIDGEMVTFDIENNTVLPFGLVKSSAKNALTPEGVCNQGYHPLFMVLDLVFLNGISLTRLPLYQRKDYLRGVLTPVQHRVEIIPSMRCSDPNSIRKSLQTAISMGSEGVILKRYDSKYEFGARNDSCIKIKPEYLEQFGENMDLVIIGRTPGKKDSLMCGLAVYEGEEDIESIEHKEKVIELDSEEDEADPEESRRKIIKFVSFCVIANGICQEEMKEIDRKTKGFWKKTEEIRPPNSLQFGSKEPEEWIEPQNSLIIEVKARSLDNTESSGKKFKTGCTLYGGYCRGIRYDKDWSTAYSLTELYRERRTKSTPSGNNVKQTLLVPKKLRKKNIILPLGNKVQEIGNSNLHSEIFRGLFFYVLSDYVEDDAKLRIDKEQLSILIKKNGGTLTNNLIEKENSKVKYRVISGKLTIECRALVERGYDIIHPKWILDCISRRCLLNLEPRHCFKVSKELMEIAENRVDIFGDSYENQISEQQLENIIDIVADLNNIEYLGKLNLDAELAKAPLFLFSGRSIYIHAVIISENIKDLIEKIEFFGGTVISSMKSCNLIIIPEIDSAEKIRVVKEIRAEISTFENNGAYPPRIPYVVTSDWITRSIYVGQQLPEEDFVPI